jgi:hypothetical protein
MFIFLYAHTLSINYIIRQYYNNSTDNITQYVYFSERTYLKH